MMVYEFYLYFPKILLSNSYLAVLIFEEQDPLTIGKVSQPSINTNETQVFLA